MSSLLVRALQALYRGANAAGFLDSAAGESLFTTAYFWYKRLIEDPYSRLVATRPELFLHGHIVDIGANIGYNTLLFSRVVSPGFQVFAFEPEEANFRRLLRAISARERGERIVARRLAVGSGERRAALRVSPAHPGDHRIATELPHHAQTLFQEVPMTSLDRFVAQERVVGPIRFVKVDVQGYELEVSRGMDQTLENHREIVAGVEFAPAALRESGASEEMLLQFYSKRGFQPYGIDRKATLRLLGPSELEAAVKKRGYIDVIFSRKQLE